MTFMAALVLLFSFFFLCNHLEYFFCSVFLCPSDSYPSLTEMIKCSLIMNRSVYWIFSSRQDNSPSGFRV
uniref:Hypothetical secreted peptide 1794 n=1 Tax=Amblyomma variegatum TaxID=34610 RepID=F0J9Y6_AMBVA|nr:TPA_inf: hypothetical secreted peptide precursor 1794 [Amblyomma variegatum]